MDIALIPPVIAASVSILALAITNIIAIFEKRKERNLSIVTKQTIENMTANKKNASKILTLTHPAMLTDIAVLNIPSAKREILTACSDLEMQMKIKYSAETEIISAMRSLTGVFFRCCQNPDDGKTRTDLFAKHALFAELMSVYDYADWRYIKSQAQGKKKTAQDFESIYKEQRLIFEKSEKAEGWENFL